MVDINTSLTITRPAAITATATATKVTCFGRDNGIISISASGGYGTYQYSIDGGMSWQVENVFTGLSPASYDVQVRDAAATSCITIIDKSLTITQPTSAIAGTASSTNVTCYGEKNGTITITATGGYGTYEYSINNGSNWYAGNSFTDLAPGLYQVLVRDLSQADCIATVNSSPLTIVQPVSAVTGTAASTNVTCFGMNNGTITVNATGGSGSYEYTIDGGMTWQAGSSFSSLAPGNYNVQVRDAAQTSCTAIINRSLAIIQPASAVAATASSTNVTCKGAGNGTITIAASGGYGTYQYSIDGGIRWQAGNIFTGLSPASYDVQVRDRGQPSCITVVSTSIAITEPPALTLDGSFAPIACYGGSTTVTLVAGGGTGALEYRLENGSFQSSNLFTGIPSGNHRFGVRDINGCEQDYTVAVPQPAVLKLTASTSPIQCDGTSVVILAAEGGTGNYQFKNGTGSYQASNTFNLGEGSYTFYVTDGACEGSVIVNIAGSGTLALTGNYTPIVCSGGNSTVTLVASGGNGNYTYKRNNGSWQSGTDFTVTSGDHVFAVRDAGGCQQFIQMNIPEPEKLKVVLTKLKDASCFGTSTGSLDLKITGPRGTAGITWFNNGLMIPTPVDLNRLPAGKYSVQVTDACSSITSSEIIIEPSALSVILRKIKDADCTGTATGALELLTSGGEGIVTQVWTRNGIIISAPSNLSALPAGTYKVTINDNCNTVESNTVIIDPASLQADFYKIMDVRCSGNADGGIGLRVFNSAGATTVSWFKNNAAIPEPPDLRQLTAGTYHVEVSDLCSRIITEKITITQPEPFITSLTVKSTVCKTSNDGIITAVTTGGTKPYSYHWNNLAQTTAVLNNLSPAVYELLVTDANGCVFKTSAEVTAGTCPPVAADDLFTTDEEAAVSGSVAANDLDRQNENLTYSMTSAVKNGRIVFTDDGRFTYTPNRGFREAETFTYRTCNTSGLCADAGVTISVVPYSVVSLTPAILNVKEGKKATVTAKLMRPFKDDVIITIAYTGSAGRDKDYVLLDQFQNIRIPKGQITTTQKITIAALTDDLSEADESVILQITRTSDPLVRVGTGSVVMISDIYPSDPLPVPPVSKEIPANPDITPDPLISPNGDGQGNDFFKIENIVSFPDNEVVIFNRWGNEVFRVRSYNESDRVFSGIANTGLAANTNGPLPDGVYYYFITTKRTVNGQNTTALNKGYLILKQ